jgi:hypothetical protein
METLVETAVENIQAGNSPYKARIAGHILQELNDEIYGDEVSPSIYHAIHKASCRNSRANALEAKKYQEASVSFKPELPDIAFASFVQTIQDKVTWMSRGLLNRRNNVDEAEEVMLGSNGIDFAQDFAKEEYNVDADSKQEIRDNVLHVHSVLTSVQGRIGQDLRLQNLDPLFLFAPSSQDPDTKEWVTDVQTNDWDEAVSAMQDIVDRLQTESPVSEKELQASNSIDFTAVAEASPVPKQLATIEAKFNTDLATRKAKAKADGITDGAVDSVITKRKKAKA